MARLSLLLLLLVLISSPSSRANPSKSAFPLTSEKLQNGLYRSNLQSKYGPGSLTTYRKINAPGSAQGGVPRRSTTSHACSSVKSVAGSACVCLQGFMATSRFVPATITGKPREVARSVLRFLVLQPKCLFCLASVGGLVCQR
ncbi:hypothetical protein ZIOFF_004335 [Zingiber officinale]|uniref:Secreted protein n=1 Tax=Zingiber officinale TaxID=94328 RepID=A0A8J5I0F3_ZINOF|nr:hypothetical protein ZIOFF_004335 [Zingiber officinale]